jgi:PTH1 family peptidyl-tRNA hydrolase
VMPWVLGDFSRADRDWLDPLLAALADNADLIVRGDDNTLMNRLAIAVQGDAAARPQRPETADPTRKKAAPQSHIRAARAKPLDTELPTKGPMADILAKMFGKKSD